MKQYVYLTLYLDVFCFGSVRSVEAAIKVSNAHFFVSLKETLMYLIPTEETSGLTKTFRSSTAVHGPLSLDAQYTSNLSPKVRLSSTRFHILSDKLPVMKILDASFLSSMGTIIKHKTIGESGLPASIIGIADIFAIVL